MILIAFRHGLRVLELCTLQWDQVHFTGRLDVRRKKNGTPSTHPLSTVSQMWTQLAEEAEKRRATFSRAQDALSEAQIVHQQQQAQPKKPEGDEK